MVVSQGASILVVLANCQYVVDVKKYVKIVCAILRAQLEDQGYKGVIFNKEHFRWL
jgi:hypothetical protein